MIYIVDIDNTICWTRRNAQGKWDYPNSKPFQYRIDKINELYDEGNTIIYWTARGSGSGIDWTELTKQQLDEWGCKYHEVKLGKPSYDVWVDDKAFNDEHFFDFGGKFPI
ncbi:hypothetical protein UFOVP447_152 [uncultured Caudovirales phage]|uniref:Uncharacterized protein n=1 Tax=uncultured Caudovirales phage TaxID=2100421 RepID=A0A6J5MEK0_9CAUD|nr:hypothetical protein UFOVP447_152 [uncultured Caudovirales phage]